MKNNISLNQLDKLLKLEREKEIIIRETKATFVVRYDQLEKIRSICFFDKKMMKDVLEEALFLYISKYEDERGKIISRNKK